MDLGLAGKSVIVTGGASNIGRSIFLTFAAEGANLVMADVAEEQGKKVINEAKALGGGGRALFVKTDVTNWGSVQAMVKKTLEEFGQIDVLVNSAGWAFGRLFIEKPREEWEKEIQLDLWSVINCARAVADSMMERKYGKIISISSEAGKMGVPGEAVYGACKGAIIALSRALAREFGNYNINVNVICPGVTFPEKAEHVVEGGMAKTMAGDTSHEAMPAELKERLLKFQPLRRLGKPQDIANMVVFLASDAASFVTGQAISVSGGYTMV